MIDGIRTQFKALLKEIFETEGIRNVKFSMHCRQSELFPLHDIKLNAQSLITVLFCM